MEGEHDHDGDGDASPRQIPLRRLSRGDDTDDSDDGKRAVVKATAGSFDEEDDEEVSETAKASATESSESEPVPCRADEEDAHRYLRLPVKKKLGDGDHDSSCATATHRHVDGQCALCIDDYEAGDQVVWSDLECPHAFHKECIMQWLSKGKKRCPVCRNWFVPGARIEDQKKLHGEDWERAEAATEQRGDERVVRNTTDLEHGNKDDDDDDNYAEPNDHQAPSTVEIVPSATEESDNDDVPTLLSHATATNVNDGPCDLECPSSGLRIRTTSETSEVDGQHQQSKSPRPSERTRAIETIEECTLSETNTNNPAATAVITDDCCRMDNLKGISAETEEAVSKRNGCEEV